MVGVVLLEWKDLNVFDIFIHYVISKNSFDHDKKIKEGGLQTEGFINFTSKFINRFGGGGGA